MVSHEFLMLATHSAEPAKPAKLETFGEIYSKSLNYYFMGPKWLRKFLIISHLVETLPQNIEAPVKGENPLRHMP